jgi:Innexin.
MCCVLRCRLVVVTIQLHYDQSCILFTETHPSRNQTVRLSTHKSNPKMTLEWRKSCVYEIFSDHTTVRTVCQKRAMRRLEMWQKTPDHQKWPNCLRVIRDKVKMLDLLGHLKTFLTFRRVNTEGLVFKMHYRATVCLILASSLIVAARQYVGDPIYCMHGKDVPHDVINTYCWIHSTFSVKSAFLKKVGTDISHPGIENSLGGQQPRQEYRYYQWVVFFLLLQVSGRIRQSKKFTDPWHVKTSGVIDGCKRTTSLQTTGSRFFRHSSTYLPKHGVTSQKTLPLVPHAEEAANFT